MSLTRRQLEGLHEERFHWIDPGLSSPRTPRSPAWLTQRGAVGRPWTVVIALAWVGVYAMAVLLEPSPAGPRAAEPLWAVALFIGLAWTVGAAVAGLVRRQRLGLVASVVAAGLALVGAVMCPVSGHHEGVGAWWFLQMAGFTALAGLGLAGLTRSRGRGPAPS